MKCCDCGKIEANFYCHYCKKYFCERCADELHYKCDCGKSIESKNASCKNNVKRSKK